ncbi:MAG: DUF1295 domain-containing protein [Polyangiales bacterium]
MSITGDTLYDTLLWGVLILSPIVLVSLLVLPAPYGRHARGGFGPEIPTRLAWVLMESPAVFAFAAFFFAGDRPLAPVPLVFLAVWQAHYIHRTFVFPLTMRARPGQGTPASVAAMGFVFNVVNAHLNATWIASEQGGYETAWLADPRFALGLALFAAGYAINRWADWKLRNLRKPGETGYKIPRGGLYERISCPNYFGEIVEWTGWAVATWSLAGLSFALFTTANLLPRALTHHRWYRDKFEDYPAQRRAVIPFLL